MNFPMMAAAERHGELITDLAAECPALSKAQMVCIRGLSAAHQAWLLGNMPKVIAVANPTRLRHCQNIFVDRFRPTLILW
ncbi:MAG TPA: hypothetical protein VMQ54_00530, partial [Steroidobacteraceae bacterium]|nr:hypothetical protein [Steroidobacteraceae bacterium]